MKTVIPLFNSPLFDQELRDNRLSFDDQNLWRFLEVVLFPETPCSVEAYSSSVCKITSPAYPSSSPLYTLSSLTPSFRSLSAPHLPPLSLFLKRIDECVLKKVPYLWGGNLPEGHPLLRENYPIHSPLDSFTKQVFDLRGVDCSGLLYWASDGATVRNTSELIRAGKGVPIKGAHAKEIVTLLEPGMIIVWKGHVLVVTEQGIVESKPETGVIARDPLETMEEILREKQPLDEWPSASPSSPSFVVRDLYSMT